MIAALEILREGAFIPAMPLVLNEKRELDEAGQRRLIRYYLAAGVDGIAVGVHTTQFAIRNPNIDLFERVLRIAAEEMECFQSREGMRILKIAGACGDTEQATGEARLMLSLGYDAALLSPGGLGDRDEGYLLDRTRRVAEILPVVGFYLQPSVGGRTLSYPYWEELCAIDGLVAIKCAAFNRYLTLDVARAAAASGRDIALYTGNDDNIVVDLLTGFSFIKDGAERSITFKGGVLGHWSVWVRTAVEIFHSIKSLDKNDDVPRNMLTLAAQITDANGAFFDVHNNFTGCIAGIHEVLRRQGLIPGIWCLDPNETLSDGQSKEIDRVYAMYPHLNDDDFVKKFLSNDC